jgi:uncharacterized delta-60 repeat protein
VVTDLGGVTNTVRDLVVQPDGSIVASGVPYGTFDGSAPTDLARYLPDGSLDPSFGDGGLVTLPGSGSTVGEGLALQADGAMVLVGQALDAGSTSFAVTRLSADGTVDAGFGDGGTVVTDVDGEGDSANAVVVQPDGRIVVAGGSGDFNTNFAVVRYLPDGAIDERFAFGGKLLIDFHLLRDVAESVALQPDGMIVVGGWVDDIRIGYGLARALP